MCGKALKLAICATIAFALTASAPTQERTATDLAVVYVGAEDCGPCQVWRRDHLPKFAASAEFSRLTYREVLSPKLFQLLDDTYWPEELRRYRDRLDQRSGVPLWFVVANGNIAVTAQGLSQWQATALPTIRSLAR